ncbi:hypothetical protein QUA07_08150 [Microcoleus sp. T3_A4]
MEKTRVDLSQNQYDRSYIDFAKRMSATSNPALHPFNWDFWILQPELNQVDCVALSFTVSQESSKVTIG